MGTPPKLARAKPPALERLIAPVRRYGVRSFLVSVSAIGVVAGILSASGQVLPLWQWIGLTGAAFLVAVVVFTLSQPRYKFWLFSLIYRRPAPRDAQRRPQYRNVFGVAPNAPVLQVAAGRRVDRIYEGGFRSLLEATAPIAVIATTPRDVSDVTRLPAGMFSRGGSRTECVVDPGQFGIPLEPYTFEREPAEGTQDIDHMLAVRDLIFLPQLAHALRGDLWGAGSQPFIWPEHCVDMSFLTDHDVCVVGGGDTNYWHAALYEPVYQGFEHPPSTVPLALGMREGGTSFYSSRTITLDIAGREKIPGLEDSRRYEFDERRFPTSAMIVACENPYARACGRSRWCVFVAGTRSLGTSGAVLALAAMLEHMRADEDVNYFSVVETSEPNVRARVSALVVRTVRVEHAAEVNADRGRRDIPTDRTDPNYRDSYVPIGVEYLDNTGEQPVWRPLVSLEGEESRERERSQDGRPVTRVPA